MQLIKIYFFLIILSFGVNAKANEAKTIGDLLVLLKRIDSKNQTKINPSTNMIHDQYFYDIYTKAFNSHT